MGTHSLLSNHGHATIIASLGCTRACAAAVGAKAVSTSQLVKFCIFTAAQIRRSKYIYLPRIMPGSLSMCRKRNLEPVLDAVCTADHWLWVPNGSSVSASKAWSKFNLVSEGILGPGRRCNKTSPFLCARTCNGTVDLCAAVRSHRVLLRCTITGGAHTLVTSPGHPSFLCWCGGRLVGAAAGARPRVAIWFSIGARAPAHNNRI